MRCHLPPLTLRYKAYFVVFFVLFQVTVIPFEKVHQSFNENFFYLNCDMLIPQRYFIDIRFKYNGEVKTFKDVTHFTIISSLDNKYF